MSSPQNLDDDDAVFGPTAADQPTAEPSEGGASCGGRYCTADDMLGPHRHEGGWITPTTALQPADDTETEVQWGVQWKTGRQPERVWPIGRPNQSTLDRLARAGGTVVHCTRTPWEEA